MATEGLFAVALAGALLMSNPGGPTPPVPAEDRDGAVASMLAVQTAMQQARDFLLHNNPRAAVETLERQLARINGNASYLALLRDAYRAYIKELRLGSKDTLAQVYQQRLGILDSGTVADPAKAAARSPALAQAPSPSPASPGAVTKPPIVRGYRQDEQDPFERNRVVQQQTAKDLLTQAEQAFAKNKFRDADALFEKAHRADAHATDTSGERWAYCKMYHVVEELNRHSAAYAALAEEMRAALGLKLSPKIENYGKELLAEIERRQRSTSPASGMDAGIADEPVAVRDMGRTPQGWAVAETANFRIYHNLSAEWVEQAARVAERTRSEMHRRWFGGSAEPWNPKCELYLHATNQDYSRITGVPAGSPGHSSFQLDGGRVTGRRIDLHCDEPAMLDAVLPHEATHVVLAGNFGDQPVPRWADEGIAVLTEPREKIDRHLRNLPKHRQDHQLFSLRQLVQMNDYPDPRYIGSFYAQSVSLVEFLSKEKGPEVFTQFVRDGLRSGYDAALQKHYGYRSFDELEQHWRTYAFGDLERAQSMAQGTP
jgi:hypothetical protein